MMLRTKCQRGTSNQPGRVVQEAAAFCAFSGLFLSSLEMFSALMAEFLGNMLPTSRSCSWFPVRSCPHLSQATFPCFLALHLYATFGIASFHTIVGAFQSGIWYYVVYLNNLNRTLERITMRANQLYLVISTWTGCYLLDESSSLAKAMLGIVEDVTTPTTTCHMVPYDVPSSHLQPFW